MKTANNCFLAKGETYEQKWFVVDAKDMILGRLAAKIAQILMGKHKPTYTPHVDTGDFVIVLNADKTRVTGDKLDTKEYMWYTFYPSGHRQRNMREMQKVRPGFPLHEAVRRMMPKNKLASRMMTKLRLFSGTEHPHQAQMPEALTL
ncbi:MAG: 50S ribosomal protein L13 [Phycisphaerae bacterium]